MKKVHLCLFLSILAASACKKSSIPITPQANTTTATTVTVTPPISTTDTSKTTQNVTTAPIKVITNISSVDLNSINFTASKTWIPLSSTAFSAKLGTGITTMQLAGIGWTHPSVLYFPNKWKGFTYWMAITPYPNGDSQWENPTIFCSNDGVNWIEPTGAALALNLPPANGYNSDPNLQYNEADGYIYCFWRQNAVNRSIYFVKSADGVNWSDKKLVCSWPVAGIDVIAPSIVKDNNNYYCYGVSVDEATPGNYYTSRAIRRMSSPNFTSGFVPDKAKGYDLINISNRPWGAKQEPWHLEVRKINNIWLLLVTTTDANMFGANGQLYMGYSKDGINFTFTDHPICNVVSTYKSSFIPIIDSKTSKINIELWRAMSNNWTFYHDNFTIDIK